MYILQHQFPSNEQHFDGFFVIYNPGVQDSTYFICTAQNKVSLNTITLSMYILQHHFPSNVKHFDSFLVIHNPGVHDSTYFICKAENKAGTAIKVIHVIIDHSGIYILQNLFYETIFYQFHQYQ